MAAPVASLLCSVAPNCPFLRFRERRLPAPLESFKSSAAPRACPPQRLAPALLKSLKPPRRALPSVPSSAVASTQASRWVAAMSFLTVSRPPPAPLESFKSSAAPRACPCSKTSAAPPACPAQQPQRKTPPSTNRSVLSKLLQNLRSPSSLPPSQREILRSASSLPPLK